MKFSLFWDGRCPRYKSAVIRNYVYFEPNSIFLGIYLQIHIFKYKFTCLGSGSESEEDWDLELDLDSSMRQDKALAGFFQTVGGGGPDLESPNFFCYHIKKVLNLTNHIRMISLMQMFRSSPQTGKFVRTPMFVLAISWQIVLIILIL